MDEDIFQREISSCQKLSKQYSGRCRWGECDRCGVIPLLFKIFKGVLLEDEKDIKTCKSSVLKKKRH